MKNPFTNAVVQGNVLPSVYHSEQSARGDLDFTMTRSNLVEFYTCPHRWRSGFARKDSSATEFGTMIDTLLLTPLAVHDVYAIEPETYMPSKKGEEPKPWDYHSKTCRAWRDEQRKAGREVISAQDLAVGRQLGDRLVREFSEILSHAETQVCVTATYVDSVTKLEIPVKCLIDVVPTVNYTRSLFDLKTCRCAHPAARSKFIFAFGYHVQAAMELDLWNAANPDDQREDFRFFGCENVPPYEPFRALLSEEFLKIGRATYTAALRRYVGCLSSGHWPGYDEGQREIDGFPLVEPASWMADAGFSAGWDESEKDAFPGLKKTNNEAETT